MLIRTQLCLVTWLLAPTFRSEINVYDILFKTSPLTARPLAGYRGALSSGAWEGPMRLSGLSCSCARRQLRW